MKSLIVMTMMLVTATAAQAQLGPQFDAMFACVRDKASRYASLDASLSDVADAAVAACEPLLDEMRPPKITVTKHDDFWAAMDKVTARLRAEALATAAEVRLKTE